MLGSDRYDVIVDVEFKSSLLQYLYGYRIRPPTKRLRVTVKTRVTLMRSTRTRRVWNARRKTEMREAVVMSQRVAMRTTILTRR